MCTFAVYSVTPKVCIMFDKHTWAKSSKLTAYDSFVLVENCFREEIISMSKLSEKSFTWENVPRRAILWCENKCHKSVCSNL